MDQISVRELRNHGGEVLDRVTAGAALTVTRDGRPVAELRPLPIRPPSAAAVVAAWRHLAPIDLGALRHDLDQLVDPSL